MTSKRKFLTHRPKDVISPLLTMYSASRVRRREFLHLREHPHGEDPKLGAFYHTVHDLSKTDRHFRQFFHSAVAIAKERGLSDSHFPNLFFRGFQYEEIFNKGRVEYDDSFREPDAWKPLLVGENGLVDNKGKITEYGRGLLDTLRTKETTTTLYQRYAGPKAVLNMLFPNKGLALADFGCGANYGLRGWQKDKPHDEATIEGTPAQRKTISQLIQSKITIDHGLGVDKNPVNGEAELKWRLACSFYPSELTPENIAAFKQLHSEMAKVSGIDFIQGDLLNLEHNHADGTLPTDRDAVILSTFLYQLSEKQRMKVLDSADASLNDNGVTILQDFVSIDPKNRTKVNFLPSTQWGLPFTYRTLIKKKGEKEWSEVLQWKSGRCTTVKPGADFDEVRLPVRHHYATPPAKGDVFIA